MNVGGNRTGGEVAAAVTARIANATLIDSIGIFKQWRGGEGATGGRSRREQSIKLFNSK